MQEPLTAAAGAAPGLERRAQNLKRRKALTIVAIAVALGAVAYAVHYLLIGARYESTDNAYVQGNVIQITPQVSGTVLAINADDTDFVKAGQTLVKLDPADARIALEQAEAQLAQTVREVRTLYANNSTLEAQVALREADVTRAKSDVQRAEDDIARRKPLVATGAVGKEEFNHSMAQLAVAKSVLAAAQSAVVAAREQLASNQVMTSGVGVERHPSVQRAAARVREAYLALQRVELPAPVDGTVARRSVQLGQRVQAGAPLMSLVPLKQVWVDANFKEPQLRRLRVDQPVTLVADLYGSDVEFHGRVAGLSAGTGSAFSLLPAQNATGNWIKVVQRVPVRIELDPKDLAAHPLRVGLSMVATVDVRDQTGKSVADVPRISPASHTSVFTNQDADGAADAAVERIIAAQLGTARDSSGAKAAARKAAVPAANTVAAASGAAHAGTTTH
ncbi:MAG TPA: HlyD family efflux transporter periplasmic adaptor subunit [Burkholderiaceae bacterium]|nr:HlyD family efflux transporter periplasmic adaptor subunit [Burkholderiaceae bacterium]